MRMGNKTRSVCVFWSIREYTCCERVNLQSSQPAIWWALLRVSGSLLTSLRVSGETCWILMLVIACGKCTRVLYGFTQALGTCLWDGKWPNRQGRQLESRRFCRRPADSWPFMMGAYGGCGSGVRPYMHIITLSFTTLFVTILAKMRRSGKGSQS
jgi:hypothetical protein